MADAWTRGSAADFTSYLSDDADFIIFDGTHLHGRDNIRAFHQNIFDTVTKNTRLEAEVKLVRFVNPDVAVLHTIVRMAFSGEQKTSASRDSMPIFVVQRQNDQWKVLLVQNSRILPMEQQQFWDDFNALSKDDQTRFATLVKQSLR